MNTEDNISLNNTKIAVMESQIVQMKELCDKLEKTLTSIHGLQTDVTVILKLQESRLERVDKEIESLHRKKNENIRLIEIIDHKVDQHRATITQENTSIKELLDQRINKTMDDRLKTINETLTDIKKRITNIEKYAWIVLGGVIVLSYILSNFAVIKAFFK
jgi:chromosome segregation ATPase